MDKQLIKSYVRGIYDFQKVRIEMGNRLCAQFRAKLGLEPSESEEEDQDASDTLKALRVSYKKITDGVTGKLRRKDFDKKKDGVISDWAEFQLVDIYMDVEKREEQMFRTLESVIETHPIYPWLRSVPGCGPAMSGVIISEIDIHRAKYVSSIWKYAGLDVVVADKDVIVGDKVVCKAGEGQGRSRKAHHLIEVGYTNADGELAKRNSITFNPWLKTKLYVLAGCFCKMGSTNKYKAIYNDYKHRLQNRPDWAGRSKGHIHNASMRYMIKMFLLDLYSAWKDAEGLPKHAPYHEAKLGLKHKEAA